MGIPPNASAWGGGADRQPEEHAVLLHNTKDLRPTEEVVQWQPPGIF